MKKTLFTFCLSLLMVTVTLYSQVLVEDNFDSYNVGDKIAETSGAPWGTWSNAPGGSEDGIISDAYASTPNNSLFINSNNDVVMLFDGKQEGKFKIEFKLLIQSGKIGYFNVIQDLNGSNSKWGVQVFFNPNGVGSVDSGDPDKAFSYNYDEWLPVIVDIDLDDDFYTFSIDNNILASGLWSKGTAGGGENKLDAVNFYGVVTGGTSGMYVDDVIISKAIPIPAPSSFSATLENDRDVQLSWTAPDMIPDSYSIYKDGNLLMENVTETYASDENIYPGMATYFVRAIYSTLGISDKSEIAIVERPGGSPRNLVLFEVGTGTGCPNCPSAARGVDELIEEGRNVAVLEYHNYNSADPFNCEPSRARTTDYYNISGYPTQFYDGKQGQVGGSYDGNLYEVYDGLYDSRKDILSLYSIEMEIEKLSETEYVAHITTSENSDYYSDLSKNLRVAITETNINYTWQGLSQIHYAVRDMYPDAIGTPVDFSVDTEQTLDINFTMDPSWVKDNCELVVFLQSDDNKEVLQTIKFDMEQLSTSTSDLTTIEVDIYPNPLKNTIFTSLTEAFDYTIYTIDGKIVANGKNNESSIDISQLNRGLYLLNLVTKDGQVKKKIIKE